MDGICPNCRSSGAVTSEATVSGLAPGNCVVTCMVGKSTCGRDETGKRIKPKTPHRKTAMPSKDVATGRRMKGEEILIPAALCQQVVQDRRDAGDGAVAARQALWVDWPCLPLASAH